MHKVKELENKWFNYKVKKILSPLIAISASSLLVVGGYYIYLSQEDKLHSLISSTVSSSTRATSVLGVSRDANNSINNLQKKEKVIEKIVDKKVLEEKIEEVKLEKKLEEPKILEKIALAPIIPVIDMAKEERIADVKRPRPVKVSRNTVAAKKNDYLTAKELAVVRRTQKREKVVPRKTKKMKFTSSDSNYFETMQHKFSKSNSPRDALLLAKVYYKKAEYVEAEKWALSANKLNNSLEESWLLFAKSKVKLGKKKEALKILVSYYKKSQSIKAKRLIGQIKTGKI